MDTRWNTHLINSFLKQTESHAMNLMDVVLVPFLLTARRNGTAAFYQITLYVPNAMMKKHALVMFKS